MYVPHNQLGRRQVPQVLCCPGRLKGFVTEKAYLVGEVTGKAYLVGEVTEKAYLVGGVEV